MTIQSQFSDDFPFDEIMEDPCFDDPGVQRISAHVGRYPSRAPANQEGFEAFCELLEGVKASWKDKLEVFIENMEIGAYENEFGQFANRSESGHIPEACLWECSQVSEMISLFTQALHYNCGPEQPEEISA